MIIMCLICQREHEGERPKDWDTLAFEVPVENQAATGSRTTQRMIRWDFCQRCEPVRQRMINSIREATSSPSRATRE